MISVGFSCSATSCAIKEMPICIFGKNYYNVMSPDISLVWHTRNSNNMSLGKLLATHFFIPCSSTWWHYQLLFESLTVVKLGKAMWRQLCWLFDENEHTTATWWTSLFVAQRCQKPPRGVQIHGHHFDLHVFEMVRIDILKMVTSRQVSIHHVGLGKISFRADIAFLILAWRAQKHGKSMGGNFSDFYGLFISCSRNLGFKKCVVVASQRKITSPPWNSVFRPLDT